MFGSNIHPRATESWLRRSDASRAHLPVVLVVLVAFYGLACLDAYHQEVERRRHYLVDPLEAAIRRHDIRAAEALLDRGAKVDGFLDPLRGKNLMVCSPLTLAIANRNTPMVQMLLRHGADPNCSRAQHTPLMVAAAYGNAESVRLLLRAGADPDAEACWQVTAASIARDRGDPAILHLITSESRRRAASAGKRSGSEGISQVMAKWQAATGR